MHHCVFIVPFVLAARVSTVPARVEVVDDSVRVILSVLEVPDTLTFNQSHVFRNFLEYEWGVYFDADRNAATGDTAGIDVSIALTHFKSDDTTFEAAILDGTQWNTWTWEGHVGTVAHTVKAAVDYGNNTITMVGFRSWPELANVDEADRFYCRGYYWSPDGIARDYTEKVAGSNFVDDPAGDTPYPFIDIVRGEFNVVVAPAAEEPRPGYPHRFDLTVYPDHGSYRSHFVRFTLASASPVLLRVFNVLGREVATLLETGLPAGSHILTWDAGNEPGGVYFIRLQAGQWGETKKVVVTE